MIRNSEDFFTAIKNQEFSLVEEYLNHSNQDLQQKDSETDLTPLRLIIARGLPFKWIDLFVRFDAELCEKNEGSDTLYLFACSKTNDSKILSFLKKKFI